jgi:hypothetical protein
VNAGTNRLIRLLPAVFQRTVLPDPDRPERPPNAVLLALLDVMTELQRPDLEVLAGLDTYFDRYQAPDAFVPLLASWLDLDWLFIHPPARLDDAAASEISPLELGRLRELVAAAARFARLRGSAEGLLDFMATATNVHGLAVDEHVPEYDPPLKDKPVPKEKPMPKRNELPERSFHLRIWAPPAAEPWRATLKRMLEVLKPAYTTAELFTARDLAGRLEQDFNLHGVVVQSAVEPGDERPRSMHLTVLAPGKPERPDDIAARIDMLTPPGDAVSCEADAGVWKKTFREWQKPFTGEAHDGPANNQRQRSSL